VTHVQHFNIDNQKKMKFVAFTFSGYVE